MNSPPTGRDTVGPDRNGNRTLRPFRPVYGPSSLDQFLAPDTAMAERRYAATGGTQPRLSDHGARVLTSLTGRSDARAQRAAAAGMIAASDAEIAHADIILSRPRKPCRWQGVWRISWQNASTSPSSLTATPSTWQRRDHRSFRRAICRCCYYRVSAKARWRRPLVPRIATVTIAVAARPRPNKFSRSKED
jgi:hypothetical protein